MLHRNKRKLSIWEIEKKAFEIKDRSSKNFLTRISKNPGVILIHKPYGYIIGRELECDKEIIDNNQGKRNTIYLLSIAVIPEMQGKGNGEKLLKKLIGKVKESGFNRITLHTNNFKMSKLAFKLGFRVKNKNIVDGVMKYYMVKVL